MPRKLRVEYPGAIYHVMNRGDRREPRFPDDEGRETVLASPGGGCGRTKLLGAEESLKVFAWSSYPDYLKAPAKRPRWLRVTRLLGEHRIAKDSAAGRAQFEAQMEQRRAAEDGRAYQAIRRGWCFGEKAFR